MLVVRKNPQLLQSNYVEVCVGEKPGYCGNPLLPVARDILQAPASDFCEFLHALNTVWSYTNQQLSVKMRSLSSDMVVVVTGRGQRRQNTTG